MVPVTPTDVTPGTTGAWVDVDVSGYVDAGNTAGVVVEATETAGDRSSIGIRNNGSTDTYTGDFSGDHYFFVIGVDSNDIFEAYVEDADLTLHLVGYITNSEGSFDVNGTVYAEGADWFDIDISTQTGGETAVAVFGIVDGSGQDLGVRENGSTDDRVAFQAEAGAPWPFAISVDANEIFEGNGDFFDPSWVVNGWLTSNFTGFTNAKNYSTGTSGSYVDVDFSGDIPSGNTGAGFQFHSSSGEYAYDIRKDGSTRQNYFDGENTFGLVEISNTRVAEQKIESTSLDLYLWGYTSEPSGSTDYTESLTEALSVTESTDRESQLGKSSSEVVSMTDDSRVGISVKVTE